MVEVVVGCGFVCRFVVVNVGVLVLVLVPALVPADRPVVPVLPVARRRQRP